MTEGAINFALSAVLKTQITIRGGRVQESNFHDFPVLRIDEAPDIEVHIISSEREPSGVGELGAMLIPAAVCNAVFAARGIRVRRLPIAAGPLRRAKG
jgi:isoquinoline 1-oxidoreductase beta subunit